VEGLETFVSVGWIDCLQHCLEQRGDPHDKALLMGVSGESFRFCFDRNDPEHGLEVVSHNPLRAACAALGYAAEIGHESDPAAATKRLLEELAARGCAILHTQAGWVAVQPSVGDAERVSVWSAERGVEAWPMVRLQEMWLREPGLLELGMPGYYYFTIGDKERDPDQRESAMGSLRRAVRLLTRKSRIDGCAFGFAAYADVRDSLLRKQRGELRQARSLHKYALWNALPLIHVRDSRKSAASYMTLIQPHFDEETQEHLRKAADGYRQAAQTLAEVPTTEHPRDDHALEAPLERSERKAIRGFAAVRRRAASRLRRAEKAEQEALLEIRRALEAAERKDKE